MTTITITSLNPLIYGLLGYLEQLCFSSSRLISHSYRHGERFELQIATSLENATGAVQAWLFAHSLTVGDEHETAISTADGQLASLDPPPWVGELLRASVQTHPGAINPQGVS